MVVAGVEGWDFSRASQQRGSCCLGCVLCEQLSCLGGDVERPGAVLPLGRQSSVGQRGCYSCPLAFTPGVKSSGAAGRPCSPAGGLCSRALLEQETRSAQPADWRGGKTKLGSDQQDCCHENRALTATAWLPRQPKTSAGAARDFPPWLPPRRAAPRREIRRRCPGRTVRLKEEKRCCGGVPAGPEPALCVTK